MRTTVLQAGAALIALISLPAAAGDWTLGLGLQAERSAYRNTTNTVSPAPYIEYQGARFGLQNDSLTWQFNRHGTTRWQWVLDYRSSGHSESDDLDALERDGSWEAGLSVEHELGIDTQFSVSAQTDTEREHNGHRLTLSLEHTWARGNTDLGITVGATFRSRRLAQHRFGVPLADATGALPAHTARAAWTPTLEGTVVFHRPQDTAWAFQLAYTDLHRYRDSPLLSRSHALDAVVIWLKRL